LLIDIDMNQVYPLYFCPQGLGHPRNHMNASFSFAQIFLGLFLP